MGILEHFRYSQVKYSAFVSVSAETETSKCRFWHFSEVLVSAKISARVGTEILAVRKSFLKEN